MQSWRLNCHLLQLLEVGGRSHVGSLSILSQRRSPSHPHRHDDHHLQAYLRRPGQAVEVSNPNDLLLIAQQSTT